MCGKNHRSKGSMTKLVFEADNSSVEAKKIAAMHKISGA